METSIKIEIFKLVQRIIMVALTVVLIYVMNAGLNKVLGELKEMRYELAKANVTISEMAKSGQAVAKELDDLEHVISNNWFYKLFGGKK